MLNCFKEVCPSTSWFSKGRPMNTLIAIRYSKEKLLKPYFQYIESYVYHFQKFTMKTKEKVSVSK